MAISRTYIHLLFPKLKYLEMSLISLSKVNAISVELYPSQLPYREHGNAVSGRWPQSAEGQGRRYIRELGCPSRADTKSEDLGNNVVLRIK
jgi:hypothetical protein